MHTRSSNILSIQKCRSGREMTVHVQSNRIGSETRESANNITVLPSNEIRGKLWEAEHVCLHYTLLQEIEGTTAGANDSHLWA